MSRTLGHPMPVVQKARELVESGWTAEEASRILANEGISVTGRTIRKWVDPALAARDRERARKFTRARANNAQFRLRSTTPEFKEAFFRRLDAEGVPSSSIAKVCTVVFGERVSRHYVLKTLGKV